MPVPSHRPIGEGSSLLGLTETEVDSRPARTHHAGHRAVRCRTWRYIRYSDATEEPFDLATDPHEFTNLADDPAHDPVRAQLAAMV